MYKRSKIFPVPLTNQKVELELGINGKPPKLTLNNTEIHNLKELYFESEGPDVDVLVLTVKLSVPSHFLKLEASNASYGHDSILPNKSQT